MLNSSYFLGHARYRVALFTVAFTLAATVGIAAEEPSTRVSQLVSPDGRHIAYGQIAVGPNGTQKVRIIVGDADGSNRRALPIDAEAVDEVQWYGNDRIAYVTKHGEDGYHLMDIEGNPAGELRMPPGCDSFFHQCLSPDGKTLAFCGNYADIDRNIDSADERRRFLKAHPDVKQAHGLFLVDLATQSVTQVLEDTVANLPVWSHDSRYMACGVGHYVKDYPLVIVERQTGVVHRPEAKGTAADWSPDSKRLAIVTGVVRGGSWLGGTPMDGTIGVLGVAKFFEGGETQVTRVADEPANASTKEPYSWSMSGSYGALWSPGGEWLAYRHRKSSQSARQGKTRSEEVWLVRPDGTGARKVLNHGAAELAWGDERTLLWVNEGQFGRIDIELDGAATLGPTPQAPDSQFTVTGHVTDGEGRPMEGVEVRAATGIGTLRTGVPVTTDAAGRYELHFAPGMLRLDGGPNLQAATIYAQKPGHYERDLCRGGNLGMANYRPRDLDDDDGGFAAIVYPGQPYKLNFVMLSGAQATVTLVNAQGEPMPDYAITLNGKELYPSSSVLESRTTNGEGIAVFKDVPLKTFWFSLGRHEAVRTEPCEFSQPGDVHFRLTYDDIAGTLTAERQ